MLSSYLENLLNFSQDQIENMVREAEANAEADKQNRERVEAINQAEGVLHDTESKMDEFKDQLPAEDVAKMKEKITEVRDKLADKDNMDGEQIKATVSELQQSSLKLFEMAYKKMAADKDSGSSSDSSSSDEKKEDKQEAFIKLGTAFGPKTKLAFSRETVSDIEPGRSRCGDYMPAQDLLVLQTRDVFNKHLLS